ncbi:putative indole-3-pyruvate monooxygenase YUCCA10 [Panicum miliaceum]|uniref:Flavin-containing monooxygenase n=1 Tax=Panicum miliaceum TaxID=4540 RepID=A0A3L6QYP8_PANMI|nr:putative indole-3-pyruvate monooxygenase YUCCA10 [Panicum miliaceum]
MANGGGAPAEVIVVGAGPSGLAVSACLSLRGVPSLVLERDDCVGSLWRKRAYDRLTLHLPKEASALPHAPHPATAPAYLPRDDFARYLDGYAARGSAGRFLVVATGTYDEKFVPEVPGLEGFPGKVMHASEYRSAVGMKGKSVLVVGCGNSGMEIALDLAEGGAITSIVVRSELHILTKRILNLGVTLGFYLPIWMIDKVVLLLCYLVFGDTSKHGLRRPAIGPFAWKQQTSTLPVIDVGTYKKIKSGEIQVVPAAMTSVHGNVVEFADGRRHPFDAIVFATGYRSGIKRWLQQRSPKAENGLYYAGLSGRGIFGSGMDAEFIAGDISKQLQTVPGQAQGNPEH